jgi:hypothetical protein
VVLVSSLAIADDDLLPATRPTFSTNPAVAPYQMMIIETGTTYQRRGTDLNLSGIEGELRLGFAHNWELDVFIPGYISGAAPRGWTDGGFQFVRQLRGSAGWTMVVGGGASVPSGQANLTAGAINPTAFLSIGHDLPSGYSFTDSFYVAWQHVDSVFLPAYTNSATISKDLGKNLQAFAELNTTLAPHTPTGESMHFGYVFAHNKDQQVDFHFGRNFVAGSGTNWFLGLGYSRKLSK